MVSSQQTESKKRSTSKIQQVKATKVIIQWSNILNHPDPSPNTALLHLNHWFQVSVSALRFGLIKVSWRSWFLSEWLVWHAYDELNLLVPTTTYWKKSLKLSWENEWHHLTWWIMGGSLTSTYMLVRIPLSVPSHTKKTHMFNSFSVLHGIDLQTYAYPHHILTWISESPNQEVTSFLRNQLVRQVALAFPTPGWEDMTITEGVIHVATRWDWNWQRKASLRTSKKTLLYHSVKVRVINFTHLELERRNKQSPKSPYRYYYVNLPVAFFLGTRKLPSMDFFHHQGTLESEI